MKKSYVLVALFVVSIISFCFIKMNVTLENNSQSQEKYLAYADSKVEDWDSVLKNTFGENYKEKVKKNIEITNVSTNIDKKFLNTNTNQINYPINFGGKYITEDDKLVIQITKGSDISSVIDDTENIIVEYVDNSYAELENVNNEIINYFTTNNSSDDFVVTNYVDVINNKVVVELPNNSEEEQTWFKNNVVDSDLIEFVKSETTIVPTTAYNSGGSFGGFCTIGYRAKLNGVAGFVTAGHCVDNYNVGTSIANYGTIQKITISGSFDAAFISLFSGNSVSNTLSNAVAYTTSLSTSSYTTYTVGTVIAKSGITTGGTSGTITNVNYSSNATGSYISNLILTSAYCNEGDSGGPVYKPGTSANTSGTLMGIVHAKVVPTNNTSASGPMIFSKANLINSSYGLTRY